MKLTKRLLALFIAAIMLVGTMPMTAFASEKPAITGAEYTYGTNVGGLYVNMYNGDNEFNTLYLYGEGETYDYGTSEHRTSPSYGAANVFHVVVMEDITRLGDEVLKYVRGMQTVQLPQSLVSIGKGSFSKCEQLNELEIPSGVTEIGASAFSLSGIKKITLKGNHLDSLEDWGLENADIYISKPFTIGDTVIDNYAAAAELFNVNGNVVHLINDNAKIVWKDYDGTVLETDTNVAAGTIPTYDGYTPVRQTDENYAYWFSGWSSEPSATIGDMEYTAVYTAKKLVATSYIDENKVEKTVKACALDGTEPVLFAGWYYLNDNVNYSHNLYIVGNAKIILSDGKTLSFDDGCIFKAPSSQSDVSVDISNLSMDDLTQSFYCQSGETGTLNCNAGIGAYYLNVYGGNINADVESIFANIYGGNVQTKTFSALWNVNILGGTFNCSEKISHFGLNSSVVLGYTAPTDSISFADIDIEHENDDSYRTRVRIADGQSMTDGTNIYTGVINSSSIKNKTLVPYAHNTITYASSDHGSVTGPQEADFGDEVTLSITPDEHYEPETITVTDANNKEVTVTDGKFIMPATAVTVTANFKKIDYSITYNKAQNGKVTGVSTANYGDVVTLNVVPNTGYELDTLTVKDADENEIAVNDGKFVMPASGVTVTATFKVFKYTVEWIVDGTLVETDENVPYGTKPVYNGEITASYFDGEKHYVFYGWSDGINSYAANRVPAVTADVTYTAIYNEFAHTYGEPEWTWAEDYSTATATFKCSGCADVHQVNATVTSNVITEPTYNSTGMCEHTASVTFNGAEYTKVVSETLDILSRTVEVTYKDLNGETQTVTATRIVGDEADLESGWYAVVDSVTNNYRINANGNINLILCDGATLTNERGITVSSDNSLTVWGQNDDSGTWNITNAATYNAAIGGCYEGNSGQITINGGTINAKGGEGAAGIGGGQYGNGTVTVNGGIVTATGGFNGSGIGGGRTEGGQIIITGGTVKADGGVNAMGIGGNGNGTIVINGGTINASGFMNGIGAGEGTITLSYTDVVSITSDGYVGTVQLEKPFTDGKNYYEAGIVSNNDLLNRTTLVPHPEHSYGEAQWNWDEEYNATASFICPVCNLTQTVEATVSSEIITAPTCGEDGVRSYTATATFNGNEYTNQVTQTIDATGAHTYGEPVWFWDAEHNAFAQFTCSLCNDKQNISSEVTFVDYPAEGKRTYTATAAFNGKTYTAAKDVETEYYTLRFDGGTGTGTMDSIVAAGDIEVTLPECGFTKEGYEIFLGWKIGDNIYQPGDSLFLSGNATATAYWGFTWAILNNMIADGVTEITLPNDITATAEDPYILIDGGNVTIDLNGHTLNRKKTVTTEEGSVVFVKSGTLNITDSSGNNSGKITGGSVTYGGGIYINSGATVNLYGGTIKGNAAYRSGGGVYCEGTMNMYGGVISNNSDSYNSSANQYNYGGGGVAVLGGGKFTMYGGDIKDNTSKNGGAFYLRNGTINIYDGSVSGNTASAGGGVVYAIRGNFYLYGGTLSNNSANNAGGLYATYANGYGGHLHIYGGVITGNRSTGMETAAGAAQYQSSSVKGTIDIKGNPQIYGNTVSSGAESNVYVRGNGTFTIADELTEGARIGVTAVTAPTLESPVIVSAAKGAEDVTYFTGDNENYYVGLDDQNRVVIRLKMSFTAVNETPASCMEEGISTSCWQGEDGNYYSDENGIYQLNTNDVVIPKTAHTYAAPEWTWSENNTNATATFTCAVCQHQEIVTATVTSEIKDGKRKYTATAEINGTTYTDTKETDVQRIAEDKYNLTVEENIDVNVLVDVRGHATDGEEIEKIVYTYPDVTTQEKKRVTETVNAADITTDENGYYAKSFTMAIAQANEPIKATIYFTGGTTKDITVSVAKYCESVVDMKNEDDLYNYFVSRIGEEKIPDLKTLCYSILDYGKNAADYFNYEYEAYPKYTLPSYFNAEPEITSHAGIKKGDVVTGVASTQMFILSKATMRLTFKDDLSSVEVVSAKIGEKALTAEKVKNNGKDAVDISGISAIELSKPVVLELSDGTKVQYAATDWARSILNNSTNAKSKALAKSMYFYSKAATDYFA